MHRWYKLNIESLVNVAVQPVVVALAHIWKEMNLVVTIRSSPHGRVLTSSSPAMCTLVMEAVRMPVIMSIECSSRA